MPLLDGVPLHCGRAGDKHAPLVEVKLKGEEHEHEHDADNCLLQLLQVVVILVTLFIIVLHEISKVNRGVADVQDTAEGDAQVVKEQGHLCEPEDLEHSPQADQAVDQYAQGQSQKEGINEDSFERERIRLPLLLVVETARYNIHHHNLLL